MNIEKKNFKIEKLEYKLMEEISKKNINENDKLGDESNSSPIYPITKLQSINKEMKNKNNHSIDNELNPTTTPFINISSNNFHSAEIPKNINLEIISPQIEVIKNKLTLNELPSNNNNSDENSNPIKISELDYEQKANENHLEPLKNIFLEILKPILKD